MLFTDKKSAVQRRFEWLTSAIRKMGGSDAHQRVANHLRVVTSGKHFLLANYHQDNSYTDEAKTALYQETFKALIANGGKPDWSKLKGQQDTRSKNAASPVKNSLETVTADGDGLKRYIENILDGFNDKDREVVDYSIHTGWLVPTYKSVEADIKQLRQLLPALTAKFHETARNNQVKLLPKIMETGVVGNNTNPFSNIIARDWLASQLWSKNPPDTRINGVLNCFLIGDGPFEATELARFLQRYKINCVVRELSFDPDGGEPDSSDAWQYLCFSDTRPVFVLGEKNIDTPELRFLLLDKACQEKPLTPRPFSGMVWIERISYGSGSAALIRSQSLRDINFISQEMLLASLFTAAKKLPAPWPDHAASHPALSQLPDLKAKVNASMSNVSFIWPTTEVTPGLGGVLQDNWPEIGLLKHLGYSVGANGKLDTQRQQVLASCFELKKMPRIGSEAYVLGWGSPNSSVRLKKMAEAIASFCRMAKRRGDDSLEIAITDWENDLAWLKRTYYDGRHNRSFAWPNTEQSG
jgi:hypothetical protein